MLQNIKKLKINKILELTNETETSNMPDEISKEYASSSNFSELYLFLVINYLWNNQITEIRKKITKMEKVNVINEEGKKIAPKTKT